MRYGYPVRIAGSQRVLQQAAPAWCVDADNAGRCSEAALLVHMRAIHAEVKGEYDRPRMHQALLARGLHVDKKRVRTLMQRHGIKAKTKRKVVTTDSKHKLPVAPDLVQRRFAPKPRTSCGAEISPTSPRIRAGCIWRPSSTCLAGRWWVGVCSPTCIRVWSKMPSPWRSGDADLR